MEVMRTEKLVAEAGDSSGTHSKVNAPLLEAGTKQRLMNAEEFMCAVVTMIL
jgi:hypothetical protein